MPIKHKAEINWPAPKESGSHGEDSRHASSGTGSGQSMLWKLWQNKREHSSGSVERLKFDYKAIKKRREHLHSNLFPLCLASFILLVSLVISGSTLFSLAASRWPLTMTGNTAKRANTVAAGRKAEDENRQRKLKTRRFLKKTPGKYKPSLCLGGLKWRTDTDR